MRTPKLVLAVMTLATLLAPEAIGTAGDGALIIRWPANGGSNQRWRPAISGL